MQPINSISAKEFGTTVRNIVKQVCNKKARTSYTNVTKKQRNLKLCGVHPTAAECKKIFDKLQAAYPGNKVKLSVQNPQPYNASYYCGIRLHIFFNKKPTSYVCPLQAREAANVKQQQAKQKALQAREAANVKQQQAKQKALQPAPLVLSSFEERLIKRFRNDNATVTEMQAIIDNSELIFSDKLVKEMQQERLDIINLWRKLDVNVTIG